MTDNPTDEPGEQTDDYPRELALILELLAETARRRYRMNVDEKGHYPVGHGERPGWHYWKANGEEHKARAGYHDDDFLSMLDFTADAVNHLVFALAEAYAERSPDPRDLADRIDFNRQVELQKLMRLNTGGDR